MATSPEPAPKYKRILLKLSGEVLAGDGSFDDFAGHAGIEYEGIRKLNRLTHGLKVAYCYHKSTRRPPVKWGCVSVFSNSSRSGGSERAECPTS